MRKKKTLWLLAIATVVLVLSVAACSGSPKNKYTVTFTGDGVSVPSQQVEEGKIAAKPDDPTLDDYVFAGWFNGDVPYTFEEPVKSDITLTARWNVDLKGKGTAAEPYLLTSRVTLTEAVSKMTADGGDAAYLNSHYRITADIDLSGTEITPIGTAAKPFKGKLIGNGHSITGFKISSVTKQTAYSGFFGVINEAEISNLTISGQIDISQPAASLGEAQWGVSAGILAGKAVNSSVSYISSSGNVKFSGNSLADSSIGGLVGSVTGGELSFVSSSAEVISRHFKTRAGGLTGELISEENSHAYITDSIAFGNVAAANIAGGAVGALGVDSVLFDVAAAGNVTLSGAGYAGGIAAVNYAGSALQNCYASGNVIAGETEESTVGSVTGFTETTILIPYKNLINNYKNPNQTVTGKNINRQYINALRDFDSLNWNAADWDTSGEVPALKPAAGKPDKGAVKLTADTELNSGEIELIKPYGYKIDLTLLSDVKTSGIFGGWFDDDWFTNRIYDGMPLTQDMKLYAAVGSNPYVGEWVSEEKKMTVGENLTVDNGIEEKIYSFHSAVSPDGYSLSIFYSDGEGQIHTLGEGDKSIELINAIEGTKEIFVPDPSWSVGAWVYKVAVSDQLMPAVIVLFTGEYNAETSAWKALVVDASGAFETDVYSGIYYGNKIVYVKDSAGDIDFYFQQEAEGPKLDGMTQFLPYVEFYAGTYTDGTNTLIIDVETSTASYNGVNGAFVMTGGNAVVTIADKEYYLRPSFNTIGVTAEGGSEVLFGQLDFTFWADTGVDDNNTIVINADGTATYNGSEITLIPKVAYDGLYFDFEYNASTLQVTDNGTYFEVNNHGETVFLSKTSLIEEFNGVYYSVTEGVIEEFEVTAADANKLRYLPQGLNVLKIGETEGKTYYFGLYGTVAGDDVYCMIETAPEDKLLITGFLFTGETLNKFVGTYTDGSEILTLSIEESAETGGNRTLKLTAGNETANLSMFFDTTPGNESVFVKGTAGVRTYEIQCMNGMGKTKIVTSYELDAQEQPIDIRINTFVPKAMFDSAIGKYMYNKNSQDAFELLADGTFTIPYTVDGEIVLKQKHYMLNDWDGTLRIGYPSNADKDMEDLTDSDLVVYAYVRGGYMEVVSLNYVRSDYVPFVNVLYAAGSNFFTLSDGLKLSFNSIPVDSVRAETESGKTFTFTMEQEEYVITFSDSAVTLKVGEGTPEVCTVYQPDTAPFMGYYQGGGYILGMYNARHAVYGTPVVQLRITRADNPAFKLTVNDFNFVWIIKDGKLTLKLDKEKYSNGDNKDYYLQVGEGNALTLQPEGASAVTLLPLDLTGIFGTYTYTDAANTLHTFVISADGITSEDFGYDIPIGFSVSISAEDAVRLEVNIGLNTFYFDFASAVSSEGARVTFAALFDPPVTNDLTKV